MPQNLILNFNARKDIKHSNDNNSDTENIMGYYQTYFFS